MWIVVWFHRWKRRKQQKCFHSNLLIFKKKCFFPLTSSFRFIFAFEISYHFLDSRYFVDFPDLISLRFGFFLYGCACCCVCVPAVSMYYFFSDAEYWNLAFGFCVVHTISWNYTSIITTIVCHFLRYYGETKYYPIAHVYICMNFPEKPSSCFTFLLVGSCILFPCSLYQMFYTLYFSFFCSLSLIYFGRYEITRATVLSVKLTTCIEYSHNFHNNLQMFLDHMYAYTPLSDA